MIHLKKQPWNLEIKQEHKINASPSNVREIALTREDAEEGNETDYFYGCPSYMIPEANGINHTKQIVYYTINLNKNNFNPTPNPRQNLNFKLNPNPNPNDANPNFIFKNITNP